MICRACGFENGRDGKFCSECGEPLPRVCAACGAANDPGARFCGQCGAGLAPPSTPTIVSEPQEDGQPALVQERRLVSVLFADLVGFTALSETRDAEDVRALLSRYFDVCSTLIRRYGGVVEKFIGDAVMAVWGTPVTIEDDAERAVRAALDLVSAVSAFGVDVDAPGLSARAGVLTGEASVALGAESEGMVLGDLVNTASRIQAEADPGTVLVGDATRRATDHAIAYEDAGKHRMKGKREPVQLWRAVRVIGRDGARAHALEASLAGRDLELRSIKDAFHASADHGRPHLISVIGAAGIGKSRLMREFERYVGGLVEGALWHRGRCPSYGEGLTYWALAEMVRMRCRLVEDEAGPEAKQQLRATIESYVANPDERRWLEPRLASLLDLGEAQHDREELFSAWRMFFERLAEHEPTVMVFEDLHWADRSLMDFVEHVLEQSRSSRLIIITLSRPELMERRPNWGARQRNFTSVYLDPLEEPDIRAILADLVPGLPGDVERMILDRAQGVPFHAIETIRMLLDRGLLEGDGSSLRPAEALAELDLPETIHALVAARLDGLLPDERRLAQDGAVLGKSFFREAVTEVSALPSDRVEAALDGLVRKEILTLDADPWSPERGQYSFLQDLVRQVAYGMIAKADRKTRHLAAANHILGSWEGEANEIVEVVAAHYLQAFELDPDATDADGIKTGASEMLERAGDRATSLGASYEAQHHYVRASELTTDPDRRIALVERAGHMALLGQRLDEARSLLHEASAYHEEQGATVSAARVSALLADADWFEGRLDEAIERMESAFSVLSRGEAGEDIAALAAQLARLHYLRGDMDRCSERVEFALQVAELQGLPEILSQALNTKGLVAMNRTRPQESEALLTQALKIALAHDRPSAALRAYSNLSANLYEMDRFEESLRVVEQADALSGRVVDRIWRDLLISDSPIAMFMLGRWDDAITWVGELTDTPGPLPDAFGLVTAFPIIYSSRGDMEAVAEILDTYDRYRTSSDAQERLAWVNAKAIQLNALGNHQTALPFAEEALASAATWGGNTIIVKIGFAEAVEASLGLDRTRSLLDEAETLPVRISPVLRGLALRSRSRWGAAAGDPNGVGAGFDEAARIFRETGVRFWVGTTLTEHAEWLWSQGRQGEAEPLAKEAGVIFGELRATRWQDRLEALTS